MSSALAHLLSVLPILTLLFLCSFLDRTNVGNAKIVGLEEDIGITDHQYDIGLTVFYLFYICRCVIFPCYHWKRTNASP